MIYAYLVHEMGDNFDEVCSNDEERACGTEIRKSAYEREALRDCGCHTEGGTDESCHIQRAEGNRKGSYVREVLPIIAKHSEVVDATRVEERSEQSNWLDKA